MTELVKIMRNLSSQHAGYILCPPQIPTLTVHWSVIGLGDTGGTALLARHVLGKVIKRSGATIVGQSILSILIREQIYQVFYIFS